MHLAAKRLSADGVHISAGTSSAKKGETLMDTARNIDAMAPDLVIMRHSCAGAPHMLARNFDFSVINAGDGINEHPTQALLDKDSGLLFHIATNLKAFAFGHPSCRGVIIQRSSCSCCGLAGPSSI